MLKSSVAKTFELKSATFFLKSAQKSAIQNKIFVDLFLEKKNFVLKKSPRNVLKCFKSATKIFKKRPKGEKSANFQAPKKNKSAPPHLKSAHFALKRNVLATLI